MLSWRFGALVIYVDRVLQAIPDNKMNRTMDLHWQTYHVSVLHVLSLLQSTCSLGYM